MGWRGGIVALEQIRKQMLHKCGGASGVPYLGMLFEMGQRAVLKAVWNSGSADGLLADTSNHLGDVDEGA